MPRKVPEHRKKVRPGLEIRDRKKALFLAHFRRLRGKQWLAAKAAGIHHNTVWEWRKADEEFARAYEQALEQSTDAMEVEMENRAMNKNGRHDLLMMFSLKARRPDKYRDNVKVENTGEVKVTVVNYAEKGKKS